MQAIIAEIQEGTYLQATALHQKPENRELSDKILTIWRDPVILSKRVTIREKARKRQKLKPNHLFLPLKISQQR